MAFNPMSAVGKSDKIKVFRNATDHCFIGRPLTVPKWVTQECCPPTCPGGLPLALGPHDEEWCDNGRMDLVMNSSSHHQCTCIGTPEEVAKEMEDLNVVALEGRRMQCESPDKKQIARTFLGVHMILKDVTEEKSPAIEKGGTKVASVAVVALQDELTRERQEKAALAEKLARFEERDVADKQRMEKKGKVA